MISYSGFLQGRQPQLGPCVTKSYCGSRQAAGNRSSCAQVNEEQLHKCLSSSISLITTLSTWCCPCAAQIQLMTRLAKLDEVEGTAVRDAYRLLVDDAGPIRHAAADLVADLLEELGSRQLQV